MKQAAYEADERIKIQELEDCMKEWEFVAASHTKMGNSLATMANSRAARIQREVFVRRLCRTLSTCEPACTTLCRRYLPG